MNEFRVVRLFLRILLEPGWAPFGVVAMHLAFAELGLTQRFDHLLHFLGGASIAYFLFRVIKLFSLLSFSQAWAAYVGAFTASCTVAVFWEFGEFASDALLHTSVQQSLRETMLDLVFGVLGATTSLFLLAGIRLTFGAKK